jgi:hypothetical protein
MMDEEEIPKKVRKVLPAVPSKSRHIDCLSSGRPDFTSRGVSAPFCLYRNQSRYEHLVLKAVEGYLDKDGNVISTALNDTLRELAPYRQATAFTQGSSAEEFPIPVRLLNDALRDENYYRAPDILRQKVHDTIISCHHYDKSLVVHCGGKHMDTLIVRETRLCRPGLQSGVPGFTLPLGKGENLVQVVCASTSRWNACSHVLARTRNQLFHVRTVSLSDEMPKTAKKYDVLGRATVVLEPLQQWQFPHNIIDLSVSPLSGACLAFITCKGGNVYSWSATEGVRHVLGGGNPTVLSGSGESHGDNNESSTDTDVDQAVKKSEETEWLNVCASMHPMMCYVTKRANLHGVDVRCTPLSMHQLFSDTSVLSSMCHHTSSPHYLFTCNSESRMSLLDVRYPKRYVFQKFIGETASSIKFQSTMEMEVQQDNQLHNTFKDPLNGVALTRRANARELLLHNVQVGVTNGGDIATRKGASCLFSLTQPFEMSSSMINCESSSFPIVDKNHEHVQSCGAVIVPLSNTTCVESTYVDKPRRDLSFNAILLQQSSLGDVHAQRILFGAPREKFWATCDITDRQHPLQKAQEAPTSNPSDLKNEHDVPFKYRKRNRKENSHLHNLYQGLTLRNNIFDSDMNGSYPLSCSDIDPSPSMNDEIVHDIVDDPKDTDNDVRDVKLLSHEETEDLLDSDLDSILGVVEMSYTLLEIQHIISEKYNAIPDWNHLRNYLSDSPRLREILLPPMRDDLPMDTSELDADKPKLVVKGEGQWAKITHVRQSQSVPRQAKRCNCEEGVAGICDLGNDCSRLHRYVYENLDANPKFYGIIESPTSSARAASSSSSSSSSSSAADAAPSSRIVKVGDEEINVDDLLSRLKKRWIENQERLS